MTHEEKKALRITLIEKMVENLEVDLTCWNPKMNADSICTFVNRIIERQPGEPDEAGEVG